MGAERATGERSSEAGFTLVEAIVAILVLIVGLAAVSNLLIVAATNNTTANKATGTAVAAAEWMEELKRRPYPPAVGGNLTANTPGFFTNPPRLSQGLGVINTRWTVAPTLDPAVFLITVQSQDQSPVTGFVRSQSVFTTLRAP
jgi:Tfp pilus assembly protein PilV